jgi:hypothetical protein
MPMKLLRQSLTVSLVFALCGCKPPDERGIEGIVFTKPITESYILHGKFPDEDSTPVAGAEAYLAFDEKGRRPIEGYAAKSDSSGSYKINTKGVLKLPNPSGEYYLVVQKPGYEPLVREIRFGPLADYHQNRVFLRRLDQQGRE